MPRRISKDTKVKILLEYKHVSKGQPRKNMTQSMVDMF
jgi:hypothetical protein